MYNSLGNNVGIFVGCNVGNMVGYFSGEALSVVGREDRAYVSSVRHNQKQDKLHQ